MKTAFFFFFNRYNSLLFGIIFRRRKLIQASVSCSKSFKFYFSKWHGNAYFFLNDYIVIQVVLCVEMLIALLADKRESLSENLVKFSYRGKQRQVLTE